MKEARTMSNMIFPARLNLGDPANVPVTGKPVGEIHSALLKLKLDVKRSDLARKEMGASTVEAVKAFQARAGLPADGRLTQETVAKLNAELAHNFVAQSKTRTQRLQGLIQQVGEQVSPDEIKGRKFGPSTQQALKAIQEKLGLPQDGRITEDVVNKLREASLKIKLSSKTQVAQVQRTLLRALKIAKLKDVPINADELKGRKIGRSTRAAIKAVQTKYGLPPTGELDAATYDRMMSVAVSIPQPVRLLKARTAAELKPLRKTARLNMKSEHVGDVQSALVFLGFRINESEFKNKVFGKSTRDAVVSYQQEHGLAVTGHAAGDTLDSLNREIQRANPDVVAGEFRYRVRGSVRNELWAGIAGAKVEVWEKLITTEGAKLAERSTLASGFFDIPYDPPRETTTKQFKKPYSLVLKAFEPGGDAIGTRVLFNPTQIAWANFTKGDQPYRGVSVFEERVKAVTKAAAIGSIANLVETPQKRQVSQAAQAASLLSEDVMQLVLAYKVAAALNAPELTPQACYAYLAQNLPPNLSGDLIAETKDWTLIDELVNKAVNGLVFMDDEPKAVAFDNAITMNLMPIAVGRQKDAILLALAKLKQQFALENPILVGNSSLKAVLQSSKVAAASYSKVADAFLKHRSFGETFWEDVNARPSEFGGAEALADLKTTIQVGQVTKNFTPMVTVLKQMMADVQDTSMNTPRDLAKLTVDQWVEIIAANGNQVPANTDAALGDPVRTYAATLANTSERLFPDVALVAAVLRSPNHALANVAKVQDLMDKNPDLDLRSSNIDGYVKAKNLVVDNKTLTGARVLQRVNQIAPSATTGRVLVENDIHSSAQIVGMGQEQFIAAVTKDQAVDPRAARTMFRVAEARYANVLQRLTDYRFELHRADPRAIAKHTYTKEELAANFGIPNLETLFGSLDYCACEHCRSVYGPAAYLADVLRFLGVHPSEVQNKSVADLFFARRHDVRKIKLNCKNTDTPLPYVDLVNEILESAVDAPLPSPTFDFQTTKSTAELRAAPENIREAAYDKLRGADFPLTLSFDLWQEQARVFLQHLGVPRWELMEAYQAQHPNSASVPLDSSIAGEFWGMSTHETQLVTTQGDVTEAKQRIFWGFGTSAPLPNNRPVSDFMRRSGLTYQQLLELIYVDWVNPGTDPNPLAIERPEATCDTDLQKVVNITMARLDKIHRFLRLWRHTDWQMWELDLLLRSSRIGNSVLDSTCLARLQMFSQLQKRLKLTVEQGLALFGDINTQDRVRPESPKE
jgi:peptidoglycan hydrolase-like protein with peptidoglycan-binding domain